MVTQNDAMLDRAKELVVRYFNEQSEKTDNFKLTKDDVFVVWFCKPFRTGKPWYPLPYLMVCTTRSPTTVTRTRHTWMRTRSGRMCGIPMLED